MVGRKMLVHCSNGWERGWMCTVPMVGRRVVGALSLWLVERVSVSLYQWMVERVGVALYQWLVEGLVVPCSNGW